MSAKKIKTDTIRLYIPDIYQELTGSTVQDTIIEKNNLARKKLYLAVRRLLRENFGFDPDGSTTDEPKDFPSGFGAETAEAAAADTAIHFAQETGLFVGVYGRLEALGHDDPGLGRTEEIFKEKKSNGSPLFNKVDRGDRLISEAGIEYVLARRFVDFVTDAVKYYNENRELFTEVYKTLLIEGMQYGTDGEEAEEAVRSVGTTVFTIEAKQVALVTARLVDECINADHPQIRRYVLNALSISLGGGLEGSPSALDINLPDLDTGVSIDIIPENVMAVSAIYFSGMLEEMGLYKVTDKIVEHFMSGMLPISRGPDGDKIYEWIKAIPQRLSEQERRDTYARVFGLGGEQAADLLPNREYDELWRRFLSSVSLMRREIAAYVPQRVVAEQIHKAARDLAVNISLHGYGIAHFAAVEMQTLIREMIDMLSGPAILTAYGVQDMWQLVDRVNAQYMNAATNGVRYRTMAASGADVIQWLAKNASKLSSVSSARDIHITEVILSPEDQKLVDNVERWLAVTGNGIGVVERYTDPIDLQSQQTYPVLGPNGSKVQQAVRNVMNRAGAPEINLPAIPQA
ncbi:MAG: hypothetical protein JXA30_22775 [Deltaproteobacteria bacterium]|nr:hypothetical protein [Deltaproteobacteria bacterium]